jgi:glutathione peroxidase-family protein
MGLNSSTPVVNDFDANATLKSVEINGKATSFYDIVEKDADGKDVSFEKYKGKVIYGVNVASLCGLTKSGYETIRNVGKIEGVQVVLFPCNQFFGQEPGSNDEVKDTCMRQGCPLLMFS